MIARQRRWQFVVASAVTVAALAGCGGTQQVEQAPGVAVGADRPDPGGDGGRARPDKAARADRTAGDGAVGSGGGQGGTDGSGSKGGAGGKGGSGAGAAESPDYVKVGALDCPRDGLVSASGNDYEAGAFDLPGAAKTPEAALEEELDQMRKGGAHGKSMAAMPYERSALRGESGRDVVFVGMREDGTVQWSVGVEQGGKSKSWLSTGMSACSPGPATFENAEGTHDEDEEDVP